MNQTRKSFIAGIAAAVLVGKCSGRTPSSYDVKGKLEVSYPDNPSVAPFFIDLEKRHCPDGPVIGNNCVGYVRYRYNNPNSFYTATNEIVRRTLCKMNPRLAQVNLNIYHDPTQLLTDMELTCCAEAK